MTFLDTQQEGQFPSEPSPNSGNVALLAAAVAVIVALAAAGLYFFSAGQGAENLPIPGSLEQGESASEEEINALEAELNAMSNSSNEASVDDLEGAL